MVYFTDEEMIKYLDMVKDAIIYLDENSHHDDKGLEIPDDVALEWMRLNKEAERWLWDKWRIRKMAE